MSSVTSTITLSELCFPDITGRTIKAWAQLTFSAGTYLAGGLAVGLLLFADARTVDFNGFLQCNIGNETLLGPGAKDYTFRYIPSTDTLQIIDNTTGLEIVGGVTVPSVVLNSTYILEATWNRTTTLG